VIDTKYIEYKNTFCTMQIDKNRHNRTIIASLEEQ